MITIMTLIKKKSDITMGQFIRYYEDYHALLANKIFPMYYSYKRHCINREELNGPEEKYSVVPELVFASDEDYQYIRRDSLAT